MNLLVTGGAGFIGSNLVRHLRRERQPWRLVILDRLTYAGSRANLEDLAVDAQHTLIEGDIADAELVPRILREHDIHAVVHLAAETHVDRAIADPTPFVRTNVLGTCALLEAARRADVRRVLVVSTDEVYGSLGTSGRFTESSPLQPSNAYAASKASADLLSLAYRRTYGLDVVVSRSTNNYGPYQHPEKLIPRMIMYALAEQPLAVYGDGQNVRDWMHVEDHAAALLALLERGRSGEIYNVGADNERSNLDVVRAILRALGKPESLIHFVEDRPGHDRRYATDASKLRRELGWTPARAFERGLEETVRFYEERRAWYARLLIDAAATGGGAPGASGSRTGAAGADR